MLRGKDPASLVVVSTALGECLKGVLKVNLEIKNEGNLILSNTILLFTLKQIEFDFQSF